jgi:hypothetical protein
MDNEGAFDALARHAAEVQVGAVRSPGFLCMVAIGWFLFPVTLQTLLHPGDIIGAQDRLQGRPWPTSVTVQQLGVGFVETLFLLAALMLFQLVCTVLFYRRVRLSGASVARPFLWPLAAFAVGVIGNACWFVCTGSFDPAGCVIGFTSSAVTILAENICEQLGRDFVFGPATGQHPPVTQSA